MPRERRGLRFSARENCAKVELDGLVVETLGGPRGGSNCFDAFRLRSRRAATRGAHVRVVGPIKTNLRSMDRGQ